MSRFNPAVSPYFPASVSYMQQNFLHPGHHVSLPSSYYRNTDYEARKGELEQIIAEYKRILYEYAKQVAFEGIKEHSNVLCFSQSAFSSSKYERNFDIGCLKSVLDEIRFGVLLDKQDEVEMAE